MSSRAAAIYRRVDLESAPKYQIVDRLYERFARDVEDARKALEMFHQVNVEVLGLVENMSQMTLPDGTVLDVFGAGATQQTAKQYNLPFLGSVDLDPQVRTGGDSGLPAALAGDATPRGREFLAIAEKVVARAQELAAKSEDVLEIS